MDFPKASIPYKKNQIAIALNVIKDFMVEKKIGFQSEEFKEKLDEIGKLVNEDYANFKNTNRDLEEIKSTKNYNDLVNHFDNSFMWLTGKYIANIDIYVLKKKNPFKHKLEFELNPLDLRKLKNNIPLCKENINNIIFSPENSLEQNWQWAYCNDLKNSLNKIQN